MHKLTLQYSYRLHLWIDQILTIFTSASRSALLTSISANGSDGIKIFEQTYMQRSMKHVPPFSGVYAKSTVPFLEWPFLDCIQQQVIR